MYIHPQSDLSQQPSKRNSQSAHLSGEGLVEFEDMQESPTVRDLSIGNKKE